MKKLLLFLCCFFAASVASAQNNARMLTGVNTQTGTSYTFVPADTTRAVTFNNASPVAVTLPNGATQGFGAGTMLTVINLGAGAVTITCSSCTINGAATLVVAQNLAADIYGGAGTPAVNYAAAIAVGGTGAPGTAFNVTASPYNAVADGSTNNATAIAAAFTAANAVALGFPTVYFPCQAGKGCKYNYGGTGVSPINPLIPMTIQCDTGVTLNYTGSAHAVDVGPTGLSAIQAFNGFYRITGCRFTDSGSETAGIFVNPWIAYTELDHNTFYDTPASGSATAWAVLYSGDGNNFWMSVHDNFFAVDNGVPSNFLKSASVTPQIDGIMYFNHNVVGCITAPVLGVLCNASQGGVGLLFNGIGSEISGNLINAMVPDIIVGPLSGGSTIAHNNLEPPATTSGTTPIIQFGFSTDAVGTAIDGLHITDNYMYDHGSSPFMSPGSANDLLTNATIKGLHFSGFSGTGPASLLVLNNLVGNTGNAVQGYECPALDEGTGGALTCPPFHNVPGNAIATTPWKVFDALNYSDGFNRANGAIGGSWVAYASGTNATITGNILACGGASCGNMLGLDFPPNVREGIIFNTVPTGTDFVSILFRVQNAVGFTTVKIYECAYTSGTGIQMFKVVTNVATQLGTTYSTTTPVAGDLLEAEAINNTLACYLNGKPVVSAVDSAISTGYPGLTFSGTTGKISSFTVRGLP